MLDKIKKWFNQEDKQNLPEPKNIPPTPKTKTHKKPTLSTKELATKNGEPYINIVKMSVDPDDIHNGEFELDWNDKFVINLIKAGYRMKEDETDNVIVDRWFQTICRNIALEMYEQKQADPTNRDLRNVVTKNLGNGRTEVS